MKTSVRLIAVVGAAVIFSATLDGYRAGQAAFPAHQVAFVLGKGENAGLHVAPGDGTSRRILADGPGEWTMLADQPWSPDGQRLVVSRMTKTDIAIVERYSIPFHFPLFLINADGTGYQRALDIPVMPASEWSADGRRVLLASAHEDPRVGTREVAANLAPVSVAVYALDVSSRELTRISPPGWNVMAPSWSPDGRRVVVVGGRAPRERNVYIVQAADAAPRQLTSSGSVLLAKWSPRGDLIAYISAPPRPAQAADAAGVFVMRSDGTETRQLTADTAAGFAWSPDGTRLLLTFGLGAAARLVDLASGATTDTGRPLQDAAFSRDGRWLLFRLRNDAGGGLYASDVQAGNQVPLLPALPATPQSVAFR